MSQDASPRHSPVVGWSVSRSFQQAKHTDPSRCEDQVVVSSLAAVVDGATDKSGRRYLFGGAEVSAGRFASLTVSAALAAIPAGTPPRQAVDAISAALDEQISAQQPGLPREQRPSCAVAVFDPVLRVAYSVGDCWIGMSDADGRSTAHIEQPAVDEVLGRMRALVHEALALAGEPWDPSSGAPDPGREAIMPLLRTQAVFANSEHPAYGYGIIDGTAVPDRHLVVRAVPDECAGLYLATDGYPDIAPGGRIDFEAAEAHLASALREDPLCVGPLRGNKGLMPGQVSFDDRSWLHLARA